MLMSKHVLFLAAMNRIILYTLIIGTCFFVSHIAINGTNQYVGRELVKNISYKLPDGWKATSSEKQFRLLEISLNTNEEFSLVVFNNIQGTADQNIDRWISQFSKTKHLIKIALLLKEIVWIVSMLLQLKCMEHMKFLEWGTIVHQWLYNLTMVS